MAKRKNKNRKLRQTGKERQEGKESEDEQAESPPPLPPLPFPEVVKAESPPLPLAEVAIPIPVQTFAFMRLPYDLQSLVIWFALHEALRPAEGLCRKTTRREVGDILCACSHIHQLAIPHLYARLEWWSVYDAKRLADTLCSHPEYTFHVREVHDHCFETADFTQSFRVFATLTSAWEELEYSAKKLHRKKLNRVTLSFTSRITVVAFNVLETYQPSTVRCRAGYAKSEESEYLEVDRINFRDFVRDQSPSQSLDEGWLSRLVTLGLDAFEFDEATASLLSNLPNLQRLVLSENRNDGLILESVNALRIVLSTGNTRTNLKAFLIANLSITEHSFLHRLLGVRVPFLSRRYGLPINMPLPYSWFSGNVIEAFDGPRCPRGYFDYFDRQQTCVVPTDAEQQEASTDPTQGGLCPDKPWKSGPSYGLCPTHYNEIFPKSDVGQTIQDEADFVRRRALECLRWMTSR